MYVASLSNLHAIQTNMQSKLQNKLFERDVWVISPQMYVSDTFSSWYLKWISLFDTTHTFIKDQEL